ncbi:hypothetical protein BaRGS_00009869 [Batillaria attramentaria]|uniref:Uncharacterized protein n=1 Tax=Batillaria attramentaria TaxID=370345 RepID=A0ABD0LI99_9CAEN
MLVLRHVLSGIARKRKEGVPGLAATLKGDLGKGMRQMESRCLSSGLTESRCVHPLALPRALGPLLGDIIFRTACSPARAHCFCLFHLDVCKRARVAIVS